MTSATYSLGFLLSLGAATPPAEMHSEPWVIVPIMIELPATRGEFVHDILASEASFRTTARIARYADLFSSSADVRARVQRCGSDVACIASALRVGEASRAVIAVVDAGAMPAIVTVTVIDRETMDIESVATAPADHSLAEGLQTAARQAFDRLRLGVFGQVDVNLDPSDTSLRVPDRFQPLAARGRAFLAPAGSYVLYAGREGYQAESVRVEVRERRTTEVRLRLTAEEPGGGITSSPWFWVAAGVAAAAAAGVAVVGLTGDDNPGGTCFRSVGQPCP